MYYRVSIVWIIKYYEWKTEYRCMYVLLSRYRPTTTALLLLLLLILSPLKCYSNTGKLENKNTELYNAILMLNIVHSMLYKATRVFPEPDLRDSWLWKKFENCNLGICSFPSFHILILTRWCVLEIAVLNVMSDLIY